MPDNTQLYTAPAQPRVVSKELRFECEILLTEAYFYHFVTATAAKIITPDVEELTSEYALDIPIDDALIFVDGFEGP